jgi:hypothetical protein
MRHGNSKVARRESSNFPIAAESYAAESTCQGICGKSDSLLEKALAKRPFYERSIP